MDARRVTAPRLVGMVSLGLLWSSGGGMEFPPVLLAAAAALVLTGPERFALDLTLGPALPAPGAFPIGLALVLVGVAVALATRAPRAVAADAGAARSM